MGLGIIMDAMDEKSDAGSITPPNRDLWDGEGLQAQIVQRQPSAIQPASGNRTSALQYPNGALVIDPNNGNPYPSPGIDMQANIFSGKAMGNMGGGLLTDAILIATVGPGMSMDYQRPNGLNMSLPNSWQPGYTNIAAYNFGVVVAAANIPLTTALNGAGTWNTYIGNPNNSTTVYGLSAARVVNIAHGYNDYQGGSWNKGK